jgi:hypothetical protein
MLFCINIVRIYAHIRILYMYCCRYICMFVTRTVAHRLAWPCPTPGPRPNSNVRCPFLFLKLQNESRDPQPFHHHPSKPNFKFAICMPTPSSPALSHTTAMSTSQPPRALPYRRPQSWNINGGLATESRSTSPRHLHNNRYQHLHRLPPNGYQYQAVPR